MERKKEEGRGTRTRRGNDTCIAITFYNVHFLISSSLSFLFFSQQRTRKPSRVSHAKRENARGKVLLGNFINSRQTWRILEFFFLSRD